MSRTLLLIDGDQYLHRGCAAVERDVKWDEENHILVANEVEAYEVVEGSITKIVKHFGDGAEAVLCLSEGDSGGFRRKLVDPSYKMHRADTRKPLCFFDLKDRLKAEYKCVFFPDLEADDVMGILSTKPGSDNKIIVSRDKDMRTIPGKLWTGEDFHNITVTEADYFHLYQTLVGDSSDGYKGCPGVGPVKAEKILRVHPDGEVPTVAQCWDAVVASYEKAGLTEADALTQARLARILRYEDWDSVAKQPILWSPA